MFLSLLVVGIFLAVAIGIAGVLLVRLHQERAHRSVLETRFRGVIDAEAERDRVLRNATAERDRVLQEAGAQREHALREAAAAANDADRHRAETIQLEQRLGSLRADIALLDETASIQSFGFYEPRYDFATSEAYAARLDEVRARQKSLLKSDGAAVGDVEWQVNGSKTEGRKQIRQTLKLMLRAFNGECDAAIARVKYNNVLVMIARIDKAFEVVNSLAQVQQCRITRPYLTLKLEELQLAFEYEEKVQQEKEEQRRIREQMREEEQAQRELARAQADAEKEEQRYAAALVKARADVEQAAGARQEKLLLQIAELEQRLADAHTRKERAIAQAQLTRSGHVYVISNVGSFGEQVYKIGMTRRLDPMERIKELGDASVPFEFDVHAVIYADDAPKLENMLHRAFHFRRVNGVNERKEFFRVGIDEIIAAVYTAPAPSSLYEIPRRASIGRRWR